MKTTTKKVKYSRLKRFGKYFMEHGILFHIVAAFLWIWALSLLAVFAMGVLAALTPGTEYMLYPNRIFPETLTFQNFVTAWQTVQYNDVTYFGMLFNSVWYSVGCALCRLVATTLCAYVVAQYRFRGRRFLYVFMLLELMIPNYTSGVSNYVWMNTLRLTNTPLFLLGQFAGHGYYFMVMHSYFEGNATEYREAAAIDGANDFVICAKIILPIAKGAIFAVFLITFVGLWNDYTTPLIYLDNYPTLMSGLFRYQTIATYVLDMPTYFAGIILAALPIGILFICFSGVLMKNLTIGGLKG